MLNFFKRLWAKMTGANTYGGAMHSGGGLISTHKTRAVIGELIRICPGGRHAWFESDRGPVRKPVILHRRKMTRDEINARGVMGMLPASSDLSTVKS